MAVNYNRLWKLLIDKKMTRTELRKQAGLSTNVIANMGHDKDVSTEALAKICNTLNCDKRDGSDRHFLLYLCVLNHTAIDACQPLQLPDTQAFASQPCKHLIPFRSCHALKLRIAAGFSSHTRLLISCQLEPSSLLLGSSSNEISGLIHNLLPALLPACTSCQPSFRFQYNRTRRVHFFLLFLSQVVFCHTDI